MSPLRWHAANLLDQMVWPSGKSSVPPLVVLPQPDWQGKPLCVLNASDGESTGLAGPGQPRSLARDHES